MEANEKAPVSAGADRLIFAPRGLVWGVLTDLNRWVEWNPDVTSMEVFGPLSPGTRFKWKAGGASIVSTVQEVEEEERIVWTGRTMGIRAIHTWRLDQEEKGVRVRTEESFDGLVARLLAGPLRKMLVKSLSAGLDALAEECERRRAEQPQDIKG